MLRLIAFETKDAFAGAVVVQAVARLDFEVVLIFPQGVEFNLFMFFFCEDCGLPDFSLPEFCEEFFVFAFLGECSGGDEEAEGECGCDEEEFAHSLKQPGCELNPSELPGCEVPACHKTSPQ